jgi:hypothetical protein
MNKTAKSGISNHKSRWTQQDAANKTYPRLKKRHKKQKTVDLKLSPEAVQKISSLIDKPPALGERLRAAAARSKP